MTIGNIVSSAMAFEAKHEEVMTSHCLTSHPRHVGVLSVLLATTLGLAGVVSAAGTASARTIYDGAWSVLIVTMSGSCDPTYRYGVQINDGTVVYDGIGPITLQGKVTPKGRSGLSCSPAASGRTAPAVDPQPGRRHLEGPRHE